ncbi:hypothetical protein Novomoskovsk_62 [Bacillus phage Novomoskovsk]|uniref:Uncharacterized protein n=1 Tax=Bacillus phage Novomoskovsk TaxID=2736258 RepID=A0A6M9Z5I6_9CAUD|nr:hypothetical protein Novomoskovsk_62 [Bacillus phage Novomoskovsk]
MSTIRKIVLTQEQAKAFEFMLNEAKDYGRDQLPEREYLVNSILNGHKKWRDDYKSLNNLPLSDLLYIATGGAWEVQKTMKEVLEELYSDSRLDISEKDGVAYAIARLKERGFIQ